MRHAVVAVNVRSEAAVLIPAEQDRVADAESRYRRGCLEGGARIDGERVGGREHDVASRIETARAERAVGPENDGLAGVEHAWREAAVIDVDRAGLGRFGTRRRPRVGQLQ